MEDFVESTAPELVEEALVCVVLFALNNCKGNRDAFKHNINGLPDFQLQVAHDVLQLYGLDIDHRALKSLCEWMKSRWKAHPADWLKVLDWHTRPRYCMHCWTPGKLCQLPDWVRPDPSKKEPGFCLIRNISAAVRNPILPGVYALGPYDKRTDWPLIDQIMWREGFGAWSEPQDGPYSQRDTLEKCGRQIYPGHSPEERAVVREARREANRQAHRAAQAAKEQARRSNKN